MPALTTDELVSLKEIRSGQQIIRGKKAWSETYSLFMAKYESSGFTAFGQLKQTFNRAIKKEQEYGMPSTILLTSKVVRKSSLTISK